MGPTICASNKEKTKSSAQHARTFSRSEPSVTMFTLSTSAMVSSARLSTTTSFRRQSQQPKRASAFTVRAADDDDKNDEAADEFPGLKYTKASEFANMSNEQILKEVEATKKMLFKLRVKQSTRKAFKGHHFDILRKKVAQLYTVRRQREVAEGVSKRDSREIMRQERKTNMYI